MELKCLQCGALLSGRQSKFCNRQCKNEYERGPNSNKPPHPCPMCDTQVQGNRSYCRPCGKALRAARSQATQLFHKQTNPVAYEANVEMFLEKDLGKAAMKLVRKKQKTPAKPKNKFLVRGNIQYEGYRNGL